MDGDKKIQMGQFIFISPEVIFFGGGRGIFNRCARWVEKDKCVMVARI